MKIQAGQVLKDLRDHIKSKSTKETAEKVAKGVGSAVIYAAGLLTYTAVSAALAAKDGVVEALHDNTKQGEQ